MSFSVTEAVVCSVVELPRSRSCTCEVWVDENCSRLCMKAGNTFSGWAFEEGSHNQTSSWKHLFKRTVVPGSLPSAPVKAEISPLNSFLLLVYQEMPAIHLLSTCDEGSIFGLSGYDSRSLAKQGAAWINETTLLVVCKEYVHVYACSNDFEWSKIATTAVRVDQFWYRTTSYVLVAATSSSETKCRMHTYCIDSKHEFRLNERKVFEISNVFEGIDSNIFQSSFNVCSVRGGVVCVYCDLQAMRLLVYFCDGEDSKDRADRSYPLMRMASASITIFDNVICAHYLGEALTVLYDLYSACTTPMMASIHANVPKINDPNDYRPYLGGHISIGNIALMPSRISCKNIEIYCLRLHWQRVFSFTLMQNSRPAFSFLLRRQHLRTNDVLEELDYVLSPIQGSRCSIRRMKRFFFYHILDFCITHDCFNFYCWFFRMTSSTHSCTERNLNHEITIDHLSSLGPYDGLCLTCVLQADMFINFILPLLRSKRAKSLAASGLILHSVHLRRSCIPIERYILASFLNLCFRLRLNGHCMQIFQYHCRYDYTTLMNNVGFLRCKKYYAKQSRNDIHFREGMVDRIAEEMLSSGSVIQAMRLVRRAMNSCRTIMLSLNPRDFFLSTIQFIRGSQQQCRSVSDNFDAESSFYSLYAFYSSWQPSFLLPSVDTHVYSQVLRQSVPALKRAITPKNGLRNRRMKISPLAREACFPKDLFPNISTSNSYRGLFGFAPADDS
jgi:hypothetical protein